MSSISFFPNKDSESQWTDHMKHRYTSDDHTLPCVFQVPDDMRETKPDAYVPQLVGLGPYHHFRPELMFMERKKRAAVKAYLNTVDFTHVVEKSPPEFEHAIRSCYDQYLDLDKRALSLIAIVDGIFLLHFIENVKADMYSNLNLEKFVADVLMLENQIPIVLLLKVRKVLGLQINYSTRPQIIDQFYQLCKDHSPLELISYDPDRRKKEFENCNHMLDFMYHMIMQNNAEGNQGQSNDHNNSGDHNNSDDHNNGEETHIFSKFTNRVKVFFRCGGGLLEHTMEEFYSALALGQNEGLKVPANVIKISRILRNLERAFHHQHHKEALLTDEIEILSVTRLMSILNIKFTPLHKGHGIGNIDLKKNEFLLPVITLRPNSETILRNLVAYEAMATTEQLGVGHTKLRDYVDLMCSLIKTDRDVQHLKDAKIILGGLANQEIVNMCNGIKKSEEKPHKESKVNRSVEGVKGQYDKSRFVKFLRWVAKKFAASHIVLKSLFSITVLFLLAIQSSCEIFDCRVSRHGVGTSSQNIYWPDYPDLGSEAKVLLPRKVLRYF